MCACFSSTPLYTSHAAKFNIILLKWLNVFKTGFSCSNQFSLSISSYSLFLLLFWLHRLYKITTSNYCVATYYTTITLSCLWAWILLLSPCAGYSNQAVSGCHHHFFVVSDIFSGNRWTDGVSGPEVRWSTALNQYLWLIQACIAVAVSIDKPHLCLSSFCLLLKVPLSKVLIPGLWRMQGLHSSNTSAPIISSEDVWIS